MALHLLAKCKATKRQKSPYKVVVLARNGKCLMLGTTHVTAGITDSGSSLVGELSGNEAGGWVYC